jgi:hypothetical protein
VISRSQDAKSHNNGETLGATKTVKKERGIDLVYPVGLVGGPKMRPAAFIEFPCIRFEPTAKRSWHQPQDRARPASQPHARTPTDIVRYHRPARVVTSFEWIAGRDGIDPPYQPAAPGVRNGTLNALTSECKNRINDQSLLPTTRDL